MLSREDFKKLYNYKARKYSLPPFEEIDNEFEIYDLFVSRRVPPTYIIKNTQRFIVERFWGAINFLHNFLFPNQQSLILMEESQKFTEEEKDQISGLVKKLTIIARKGTAVEIKNDEKENAEYINELYGEWLKAKKGIVEIADKNLAKWKSEPKSEKGQYFG